jgi:hypothetical protein
LILHHDSQPHLRLVARLCILSATKGDYHCCN